MLVNKRKIRSFVIREGRMTGRQSDALSHFWPELGLDYQTNPYDWQAIFGNTNPLVIEIGFGMGHSLKQMAQANPEINYVGIEVHRPGVGCLMAALKEEGINNVRIINHDAVEVLEHAIADGGVSGFQIFFPDPWPKKKHHKRRIIQAPFVELLCKKLSPQGFIHCATDWQEYAEFMMEVLSASPKLSNQAGNGQYLPRPEFRPLTKFEARGQRLNHGVWDLMFHI